MMSTQTVQTRSTSRYEGMQATGRERDGTKAEQEAVTATTEKWFPFYYINFFFKNTFLYNRTPRKYLQPSSNKIEQQLNISENKMGFFHKIYLLTFYIQAFSKGV